MSKTSIFVVLSVVIPLALRFQELWAAPLVAQVFGISGISAADILLLVTSFLAALLCWKYYVDIGVNIREIRIDVVTVVLFVLVIVPALIMATRFSVTMNRFSFISTAVSEELMCRGVWFSIVDKVLNNKDNGYLSKPVLMSTLFFVVWHIPFDLNPPSLLFIITGIYSSYCFGLLRQRSKSLYPGMVAHMLKLLLH